MVWQWPRRAQKYAKDAKNTKNSLRWNRIPHYKDVLGIFKF
jgi:hypothetical protein